MKIMIFTEGTIIMHLSGGDVSREERVRQSQKEGIQGEERRIAYESNSPLPSVEPGSVYDLKSYIPVGNSVGKIWAWYFQGAGICYLTSRRIKGEIDTIRMILGKYKFPNPSNLYYRQQNKSYKDIAEDIMPDVLIEDDCESIGGEKEMTYPHINESKRQRIKSVVVREFGGIDHLPDDPDLLGEVSQWHSVTNKNMSKYLDLIEKVEGVRYKVKNLIDRFPANKREAVLFDKWSLKDVVAHLNTWMVHDIDCLENLMRGAEPYWEPDVDKFNEEGVSTRKSKSWEEVYDEFVFLVEKLNRVYRQLPEDLFEVNIWKNHDETAVKFLEGEIRHWEGEHVPLLEKIVNQ